MTINQHRKTMNRSTASSSSCVQPRSLVPSLQRWRTWHLTTIAIHFSTNLFNRWPNWHTCSIGYHIMQNTEHIISYLCMSLYTATMLHAYIVCDIYNIVVQSLCIACSWSNIMCSRFFAISSYRDKATVGVILIDCTLRICEVELLLARSIWRNILFFQRIKQQHSLIGITSSNTNLIWISSFSSYAWTRHCVKSTAHICDQTAFPW